MINSGDVVLLSYPYTDYTRSKRRPVVIVAERPDFANEYLVAFMTSRVESADEEWDILLDPVMERDKETRLHKPTVIKSTKIHIVSVGVITGIVGKINPELLKNLKERIVKWLSD